AHLGIEIGFRGSSESPAIEGDVTVRSAADNGGSANASALAGLTLIARLRPTDVVGNVDVAASAHDAGGGNAIASAVAGIDGGGSIGSPGVQIGASTFDEAVVG